MQKFYLRLGTYSGLTAFTFLAIINPITRIYGGLVVAVYLCYMIFDTLKMSVDFEKNMVFSSNSIQKAIVYNLLDICLFIAALAVAVLLSV